MVSLKVTDLSRQSVCVCCNHVRLPAAVEPPRFVVLSEGELMPMSGRLPHHRRRRKPPHDSGDLLLVDSVLGSHRESTCEQQKAEQFTHHSLNRAAPPRRHARALLRGATPSARSSSSVSRERYTYPVGPRRLCR